MVAAAVDSSTCLTPRGPYVTQCCGTAHGAGVCLPPKLPPHVRSFLCTLTLRRVEFHDPGKCPRLSLHRLCTQRAARVFAQGNSKQHACKQHAAVLTSPIPGVSLPDSLLLSYAASGSPAGHDCVAARWNGRASRDVRGHVTALQNTLCQASSSSSQIPSSSPSQASLC